MCGLWGGTRFVGILNAQLELAAMVFRKQIVEQRRARAADMQHTSGGGSKAGDNGHDKLISMGADDWMGSNK